LLAAVTQSYLNFCK